VETRSDRVWRKESKDGGRVTCMQESALWRAHEVQVRVAGGAGSGYLRGLGRAPSCHPWGNHALVLPLKLYMKF
jgi:hypothetical protein